MAFKKSKTVKYSDTTVTHQPVDIYKIYTIMNNINSKRLV